MLNKFFNKDKKIYLNDRHEEANTDQEDRRKLYEKRIFPLLNEDDLTILAEPIDNFLWNYYKNLGLARIKKENVFIASNYLNYLSLTKAALEDKLLLKKIKKNKPKLLIPYIESRSSELLAEKLEVKLLRKVDFVEWINNKANYRQVAKNLFLDLIVSGFRVSNFIEAKKAFNFLKKQGFKGGVLKKERSVAGFGIFIVKNKKELAEQLKKHFYDQDTFLIEGLISEIDFTFNLQYFIGLNKIDLVCLSDQILGKDKVSYQGSVYPSQISSKKRLFQKAESFGKQFAKYLQAQQAYGFVGIDFLLTQDKKIYSTEANVRFNASTFNSLIVDYLFDAPNSIFWKTFSLNQSFLSFKDLFIKNQDLFIKQKNQPGVFPIGVDLLESLGEGQFMAVGQSFKEINSLEKRFRNNFKNEK